MKSASPSGNLKSLAPPFTPRQVTVYAPVPTHIYAVDMLKPIKVGVSYCKLLAENQQNVCRTFALTVDVHTSRNRMYVVCTMYEFNLL